MNIFKTEFTEKNMTRNAGLTHYGRFMQKLNLPAILVDHISIVRGENAQYTVSDIICMLILGVLAGAKHISHMQILKTDGVLRKIFNWNIFPDASTFSRIFKLFEHRSCNELSEAEAIARRKVWKQKWFGRVTLDFDSSVIGVYGSQEGTGVGYNPKKKGQKSYHPIFCFIAETCECLHNWLRDGSAYSANGIVDFTKECFERLPKGVWKIFVRADNAFFNGKFLDYLESQSALYLIKGRFSGLETILSGLQWRNARHAPGFETAEFWHKCESWSKSRRFVAVRIKIAVKNEDPLFPGLITFKYTYFAYVTNDPSLTPMKAHKTYGKRGTSENWIQWCKNQTAAGSILMDNFWANAAIFQTCILAYNLNIWMITLASGSKYDQEPNSIRFWLIYVPGRLLMGSRQFRLKLPKDWTYKDKWLQIETGLERIAFP